MQEIAYGIALTVKKYDVYILRTCDILTDRYTCLYRVDHKRSDTCRHNVYRQYNRGITKPHSMMYSEETTQGMVRRHGKLLGELTPALTDKQQEILEEILELERELTIREGI